jgi:hypothetical protein
MLAVEAPEIEGGKPQRQERHIKKAFVSQAGSPMPESWVLRVPQEARPLKGTLAQLAGGRHVASVGNRSASGPADEQAHVRDEGRPPGSLLARQSRRGVSAAKEFGCRYPCYESWQYKRRPLRGSFFQSRRDATPWAPAYK